MFDSKEQNVNKGKLERKKELSNIGIVRYDDSIGVSTTMKRPKEELGILMGNFGADVKIQELYNEISLFNLSQKKLMDKNDYHA